MANLKSSTLNGNLSVSGSISLNGEILDLSKFVTNPLSGNNNTGAAVAITKLFNSTGWGTSFIRNSHSLVENASNTDIIGFGPSR